MFGLWISWSSQCWAIVQLRSIVVIKNQSWWNELNFFFYDDPIVIHAHTHTQIIPKYKSIKKNYKYRCSKKWSINNILFTIIIVDSHGFNNPNLNVNSWWNDDKNKKKILAITIIINDMMIIEWKFFFCFVFLLYYCNLKSYIPVVVVVVVDIFFFFFLAINDNVPTSG